MSTVDILSFPLKYESMIRKLITKIKKKSQVVVERIMPYIKESSKLVDIGSSTGDVAYLLKNLGKDVTAVNVF